MPSSNAILAGVTSRDLFISSLSSLLREPQGDNLAHIERAQEIPEEREVRVEILESVEVMVPLLFVPLQVVDLAQEIETVLDDLLVPLGLGDLQRLNSVFFGFVKPPQLHVAEAQIVSAFADALLASEFRHHVQRNPDVLYSLVVLPLEKLAVTDVVPEDRHGEAVDLTLLEPQRQRLLVLLQRFVQVALHQVDVSYQVVAASHPVQVANRLALLERLFRIHEGLRVPAETPEADRQVVGRAADGLVIAAAKDDLAEPFCRLLVLSHFDEAGGDVGKGLVDLFRLVALAGKREGGLKVGKRKLEVALSQQGAAVRNQPRERVGGRPANLAHRLDLVPLLFATSLPGLPLDELDEMPHFILGAGGQVSERLHQISFNGCELTGRGFMEELADIHFEDLEYLEEGLEADLVFPGLHATEI